MNIFHFLSGRPKSGEILKCIYPWFFIPQILILISLNFINIKNSDPFYILMALGFTWQIGWIMSNKRFVNKEGWVSNKERTESIKIFIWIPLVLLSIILSFLSINNISFGIIAQLITWCCGWNMSIEKKY